MGDRPRLPARGGQAGDGGQAVQAQAGRQGGGGGARPRAGAGRSRPGPGHPREAAAAAATDGPGVVSGLSLRKSQSVARTVGAATRPGKIVNGDFVSVGAATRLGEIVNGDFYCGKAASTTCQVR